LGQSGMKGGNKEDKEKAKALHKEETSLGQDEGTKMKKETLGGGWNKKGRKKTVSRLRRIHKLKKSNRTMKKKKNPSTRRHARFNKAKGIAFHPEMGKRKTGSRRGKQKGPRKTPRWF